MPIYEFKCPRCGATTTTMIRPRDGRLHQPCPALCGFGGPLRRVFSFTFRPVLHAGWNPTVGREISDHKQFASELTRASDKAEEETGIPHRYAPVDYGDLAPEQ